MTDGFRTLDGVAVSGRRVLVREDFNVPLQDGKVSDDTRLQVALPTIRRLRDGGAKTILISHFDRPKGKRVPSMSLKPVVAPLAKLIGAPVAFAEDCIGETARDRLEGFCIQRRQFGDVAYGDPTAPAMRLRLPADLVEMHP